MTLQDVMENIEGNQFAAEANLAAGFDAFYRSVQSCSLFRELAYSIKYPGALKTLLNRSGCSMNPFDSAMAAYLMAVERGDSEVASVVAEAFSKAPNCNDSVAKATRGTGTGDLRDWGRESREDGALTCPEPIV